MAGVSAAVLADWAKPVFAGDAPRPFGAGARVLERGGRNEWGRVCIASRVEVKKLCIEVRVGTSADVSIRALRGSGGLWSP